MKITAENRNKKFVMPSEQELGKLYEIATSAHPKLAPPRDAIGQELGERQRAFRLAFTALAHAVGRAPKPDTGRAWSWWCDELRSWLTEQGMGSVEISVPTFTIACLSHGDIFYHPLDRLPFDLAFALELGSMHPATDKWKRVLETGAVLPPTSPTTARPVEIVQLQQVFGGGRGVGAG